MSMLNFESVIIMPEEALQIKAKYCSRHVFKLEEKNLKSFLTPNISIYIFAHHIKSKIDLTP